MDMRRILAVAAALAASLALTPAARAGTIYGDGGTHALAGPATDVTVTGGTTLDVGPGADVTAASNAYGLRAVDSDLVVSGGAIAGPVGLGFFAAGTTSTLAISGGTFTGTAAGPPGSGATVYLDGPQPVATISGGAFSASAATPDGALAVFEDHHAALTISGGTFDGHARAGTGTIDLLLFGRSSVTFLGSGFAAVRVVDPQDGPGESFYHVTGTLASGVAADLTVRARGDSYAVVASADGVTFTGLDGRSLPAPASLATLATGLLPVLALAWRRRRAGNRTRC